MVPKVSLQYFLTSLAALRPKIQIQYFRTGCDYFPISVWLMGGKPKQNSLTLFCCDALLSSTISFCVFLYFFMYAKNCNNLEHKNKSSSYFRPNHFNLPTWMTTEEDLPSPMHSPYSRFRMYALALLSLLVDWELMAGVSHSLVSFNSHSRISLGESVQLALDTNILPSLSNVS